MTNSTSTDKTFGAAWRNRVALRQEDFHSTAPVYKKSNEMLQSTTTTAFTDLRQTSIEILA